LRESYFADDHREIVRRVPFEAAQVFLLSRQVADFKNMTLFDRQTYLLDGWEVFDRIGVEHEKARLVAFLQPADLSLRKFFPPWK
jgi:hypothetical protein